MPSASSSEFSPATGFTGSEYDDPQPQNNQRRHAFPRPEKTRQTLAGIGRAVTESGTSTMGKITKGKIQMTTKTIDIQANLRDEFDTEVEISAMFASCDGVHHNELRDLSIVCADGPIPVESLSAENVKIVGQAVDKAMEQVQWNPFPFQCSSEPLQVSPQPLRLNA